MSTNLLPQGGGQDAYGPGAPPALGTGGLGPQDMVGGNPTDPSATVAMQPQPQMGGPTVAEAIQQAISDSMQQLDGQQQQEKQAVLMQQLDEAQQVIASLMQAIGGEAQTLDGAGNLPPGQPMGAPPLGAPAGQDLNALLPSG